MECTINVLYDALMKLDLSFGATLQAYADEMQSMLSALMRHFLEWMTENGLTLVSNKTAYFPIKGKKKRLYCDRPNQDQSLVPWAELCRPS